MHEFLHAYGAYALTIFTYPLQPSSRIYVLYLATIVMTVTSERARLALVPMLLPFAGYFVDAVLGRARLASWLPALALSALAVHWPVLSAEQRDEDLLKRDYNYAVVLLQAGP